MRAIGVSPVCRRTAHRRPRQPRSSRRPHDLQLGGSMASPLVVGIGATVVKVGGTSSLNLPRSEAAKKGRVVPARSVQTWDVRTTQHPGGGVDPLRGGMVGGAGGGCCPGVATPRRRTGPRGSGPRVGTPQPEHDERLVSRPNRAGHSTDQTKDDIPSRPLQDPTVIRARAVVGVSAVSHLEDDPRT